MTKTKIPARVMAVVICLAFFVALIPPPKAHAVVGIDDALLWGGIYASMYSSLGMVAPDATAEDWYNLQSNFGDPTWTEVGANVRASIEEHLAANPNATYVPVTFTRDQYSVISNQILAYHQSNPSPFGRSGSGTLAEMGIIPYTDSTSQFFSELQAKSSPAWIILPGARGFHHAYIFGTAYGNPSATRYIEVTGDLPVGTSDDVIFLIRSGDTSSTLDKVSWGSWFSISSLSQGLCTWSRSSYLVCDLTSISKSGNSWSLSNSFPNMNRAFAPNTTVSITYSGSAALNTGVGVSADVVSKAWDNLIDKQGEAAKEQTLNIPITRETIREVTYEKVISQDIADTIADAPPIVVPPTEGDIPDLTIPEQIFTTKFPFCIPWDIYNAVSNLSSSSVEPVFTVPIDIQSINFHYDMVLDLSEYGSLIAVMRWGISLLFVFGLILATRGLIGAGG